MVSCDTVNTIEMSLLLRLAVHNGEYDYEILYTAAFYDANMYIHGRGHS